MEFFRNKSIKKHVYIGTDQWTENGNNQHVDSYEEIVKMPIENIEKEFPEFLRRAYPTANFSSGTVLELGCGNGDVTRFICKNPNVKKIYAMDLYDLPLELLEGHHFPKTVPVKGDVSTFDFATLPGFDGILDTVTLCEIIEHISLKNELKMLENLRNHIRPFGMKRYKITGGTRFVISTPIGFMPDPNHCRGFTKHEFIAHIEKYYGIIEEIHYNHCQQTACGYFTNTKRPLKFEFEILGNYDYLIFSKIGEELARRGHHVNYYLTSEEELGKYYNKKFADNLKSQSLPNLTFERDLDVDCYASLQPPITNAYKRKVMLLYGSSLISVQPGFGLHPSSLKALDGLVVHGPYTAALAAKVFDSKRTKSMSGAILYDDMFVRPPVKSEILKRLSIPEDRKIIVYLPTWDEHCGVELFYDALKKLAEKYTLVVRAHESIFVLAATLEDGWFVRKNGDTGKEYRFNLSERIRKLTQLTPHNLTMSNSSLPDVMAIADMVLSDAKSAVTSDCLLCRDDVPIIGLSPLSAAEIKERFMPEAFAIMPLLNLPDDLLKMVETLFEKDLFSEQRSHMRHYFFGDSLGKAVPNTADALTQFADIPCGKHLFKKEKLGNWRIIHFLGFKIKYQKNRKYRDK